MSSELNEEDPVLSMHDFILYQMSRCPLPLGAGIFGSTRLFAV
jgi:hypothetical protein